MKQIAALAMILSGCSSPNTPTPPPGMSEYATSAFRCINVSNDWSGSIESFKSSGWRHMPGSGKTGTSEGHVFLLNGLQARLGKRIENYSGNNTLTHIYCLISAKFASQSLAEEIVTEMKQKFEAKERSSYLTRQALPNGELILFSIGRGEENSVYLNTTISNNPTFKVK